MAITKLQAPSNGQPISRPLLHYIWSNQTSYSDFAYLFDVYYYPVGGTPGVPVSIGKFKVVPDPTYANGVFDASRIIKGYIQTTFEPTENLLAWSTDKIACTYRIIYGEYYSGSSHYASDLDDCTVYYLWSDILNASPLPTYPTDFQWLTDRDTTNIKVPRNKTFFLPVNNSKHGTAYTTQRIAINAINSSGGGGLSQNYDKTASEQCLQLNLNSYIIYQEYLNATGDDLDTDLPDWWIGSLQVKNNFSYSTVKTSIATLYYTCPKYNSMQLHFLNRYGVFETMSFDAIVKQNAAFEHKTYKRQGIELASSTVSEQSFFDDTSDYGETYVMSTKETNFFSRHDYTYKLTSDWVNETDHNWLKQLIASPLVYTDVYTQSNKTVYYPVIVKTANWEQKISGADKMFNLELEINVGQIIL